MLLIRKRLASKNWLILVFVLTLGNSANAGIPTIDIAGLVQGIISALESVSQTLKQIEQYQMQLQQFENQLRNTTNPSSWVWDDARNTMRNLVTAVDTLSFYKNRLGSLNSYLDKFKDLEYYKSSPCFSNGGCSAAQVKQLQDNLILSSQTQKKANDAVFKGLDVQQKALETDAGTLQRIQSNAETAEGQLQAIQYANQLASHQSNQLLQIRGLLVSQQNAAASLMQAKLDREAQETAANANLRAKSFSSSPVKNW